MNNQITCIQLATFFTLDFARDHSIDFHHSLETKDIIGGVNFLSVSIM